MARQPGVLAGLPVALAVLDAAGLAPEAAQPRRADGDRIGEGSELLRIRAPLRELLGAERTLLNFLTHLSGIATATRAWADALAGTRCAVRDTRKTTPGLRQLEKYAVRCGGGQNHRMGLGDAALIKDNHVAAAGGVAAAIAAVRAAAPSVALEVECDTLAQVREALDAGAALILLDNMGLATLRAAVALAAGTPGPGWKPAEGCGWSRPGRSRRPASILSPSAPSPIRAPRSIWGWTCWAANRCAAACPGTAAPRWVRRPAMAGWRTVACAKSSGAHGRPAGRCLTARRAIPSGYEPALRAEGARMTDPAGRDYYPPGDLRVSDADRDRALSELSEAFQAGRITADEFDQRSGQVLRARTGKELTAPLADLPVGHPAAASATAPERAHRLPATRITIGASVAAICFAAVAAAAALSSGPTLQQRELMREMLSRHGLSVPLPPAAGFNWPGTIAPAAIAVLLVVLIIFLHVARTDRP